jgi:hypothetical protein
MNPFCGLGSKPDYFFLFLHLEINCGRSTLTPIPFSQLFSSFAPDVQHWPENETINPKLN